MLFMFKNLKKLSTMENNKKPLIFVTNDDGVEAKGFWSAIKVARKFGRVIAVGPERPQSGMSHAITMHIPLFIKEIRKEEDLEVYACSGTPVDCVKMAFDYLLKNDQPVLTISGINHGSNSAINVLYSGTMGAAIEASFYGAPSVGLSLLDHDEDADFAASEVFAERIIRQVLSQNVEEPLCLNVNIPCLPEDQIKGIMVCRQNAGYWKERFICGKDPRDKDYFWLTGHFINNEPEATDTDVWALDNNYVAVVPVNIDFSHYAQIKQLKQWDL